MPPPARLYDSLVRFGLKPESEFDYNAPTDTLMRVRGAGVRKLVDRRWSMKKEMIHISLIPDDMGVVQTAIVTIAEGDRRPGFWYVVMDTSGRPVAEYPLTYSKREIVPAPLADGKDSCHPPSATGAVKATVETTGDLARLMVSWLVGYDRVNDDDSAVILEILSVHALSPREIKLPLKSGKIARRLHDELLCFEDDVNGIPGASDQSAKLRKDISRLFTEGTLEYP